MLVAATLVATSLSGDAAGWMYLNVSTIQGSLQRIKITDPGQFNETSINISPTGTFKFTADPADNGNTTVYTIEDVLNIDFIYSFSEYPEESALESVNGAGEAEITVLGGGYVEVKCSDPSEVKVYDLNGRVCNVATTPTEGYCTLTLSQLPAGIYLVTNSKTALKVTTK